MNELTEEVKRSIDMMDYQSMLEWIAPLCREVICLPLAAERAADPRTLHGLAGQMGLSAMYFTGVEAAYSYALSRATRDQIFIGAGSFLTVALLKNYQNSLDN